MEYILPKQVLPICISIDPQTIQIGLQDVRTHEIIDCCQYESIRELDYDAIKLFWDDYEKDMEKNGII